MSECKIRKWSTDFIVGVKDYSAKWFSGIKSPVYETGSMGINVLADNEAMTEQDPITYQVRLSP